jgi:hypothetical protein
LLDQRQTFHNTAEIRLQITFVCQMCAQPRVVSGGTASLLPRDFRKVPAAMLREGHTLDVDRSNLRPPESAGEAHENQSAVMKAEKVAG